MTLITFLILTYFQSQEHNIPNFKFMQIFIHKLTNLNSTQKFKPTLLAICWALIAIC